MRQNELLQMRSMLAVSLGWCLLLPAAGAADVANELAVVSDLGRLNGIALACRQPALSTRLRDMVINMAPKERQVGEVFEQATSTAYLAQGRPDATACPDSRELASHIEAGEAALKKQYPKRH